MASGGSHIVETPRTQSGRDESPCTDARGGRVPTLIVSTHDSTEKIDGQCCCKQKFTGSMRRIQLKDYEACEAGDQTPAARPPRLLRSGAVSSTAAACRRRSVYAPDWARHVDTPGAVGNADVETIHQRAGHALVMRISTSPRPPAVPAHSQVVGVFNRTPGREAELRSEDHQCTDCDKLRNRLPT